MRGTNTVIINGQPYDAVTGLPVKETPVAQAALATVRPTSPPAQTGKISNDIGPRRQDIQRVIGAGKVHSRTQKSQTLYRAAVKRPAAAPGAQRIPLISKFAPHPAGNRPVQPVAAKPGTAAAQAPAQPAAQSAKITDRNQLLKKQLIKERINQAETAKKQRPKKSKLGRLFAKRPKFASITTASLALLLLGAYVTYLNLPGLSVRVAAARAGINASYPGYSPDGYGLHGAVGFAAGEVTLNFKSNTNDQQNYTVKQRASAWDSQAVIDNYINKEPGTHPYMTYSAHGLTVYMWDNNAAWVNNGILYTVNGNAPLTSDQMLHLASSM